MKFSEFEGQEFDFFLAQSVFTHLPAEIIEECFAHIGTCMHNDSRFYFTYFLGKAVKQTGVKDFSYPQEFFEDMASKYGFHGASVSASYPHPVGQKMFLVSNKRDTYLSQ